MRRRRASGFGRSLGAALAGLEEVDFMKLVGLASRHYLLLRAPRAEGVRWAVHPLVAELLRGRGSDAAEVVARVTGWFVERLPKSPAGEEDAQGKAWGEIQGENRALVWWLRLVPEGEHARVVRAGSSMAMTAGPFRPWLAFYEAAEALDLAADDRSWVLWTLGRVALSCGELSTAEAAARANALHDSERGAERDAALAWSIVADIAAARGELDEALRIRREEELPVYEKLGDVRSILVTRAKVAMCLLQSEPSDRHEARNFLRLALVDAERLRIPEAQIIRQIAKAHNLDLD